MGDERAETYLRRLAEVQLRRAGDRLRGVDAAVGTGNSPDPGMVPFATAEEAHWKVERAGRILIAAGAFDELSLRCLSDDLYPAIQARSRFLMDHARGKGALPTMFPVSHPRPPPDPGGRVVRVTPIGRSIWAASDPAPLALHLLSLVRTEADAMITVVMRLYRAPDEPATQPKFSSAGPDRLQYEQRLCAVDDVGTSYEAGFWGGTGERTAWRGVIRLSPMPPPDAGKLDLIADGASLVQIPLRPATARGRQVAPSTAQPAPIPPAERLLVLEAERILASGDARGPREGPTPGEIITVLTETGTIAADSRVPGQLAALCQRLGATGHGITVPAAAQLPERWASVMAHLAPSFADGPEAYVPLARILPDVDGARFALAGLSMAAGESHLHVVASGMSPLCHRFAHNWKPGFSWWLRDGSGNWHVAVPAAEPSHVSADGTQAFLLRLTPPLAAVPDTAEVVITGPATQLRATVPIEAA